MDTTTTQAPKKSNFQNFVRNLPGLASGLSILVLLGFFIRKVTNNASWWLVIPMTLVTCMGLVWLSALFTIARAFRR